MAALAMHGGRVAHGEAAQPAARHVSRRLRRAARPFGLRRWPTRSGFTPDLIPITKGVPPLRQYINCCRSSPCSSRSAFHLQGLYRLRRGRSRVDDFFAVFVGSILAVVFGIIATLYMQTYYRRPSGARRLRGVAGGLGHVPRS